MHHGVHRSLNAHRSAAAIDLILYPPDVESVQFARHPQIVWTFPEMRSIMTSQMLDYVVLKGPVLDFGREDSGSSPHFEIVVGSGNNRLRVPVNVKSTDGSTVLFSVVEPLVNHRLLAELPQL